VSGDRPTGIRREIAVKKGKVRISAVVYKGKLRAGSGAKGRIRTGACREGKGEAQTGSEEKKKKGKRLPTIT